MKKIRVKVEALPQIPTEVAIAGSARRQEVGGGVCMGIALGIAIYAAV